MPEEPFESYESPDGLARWYFSYSDKKLTTGVLILQPGGELPKHQRPISYESSIQISGKSRLTVFNVASETDIERTITMNEGDQIRLEKGRWHIHANPFDEISITFFKHVGDMTEVMKASRRNLKRLPVNDR